MIDFVDLLWVLALVMGAVILLAYSDGGSNGTGTT